MHVLRIFASIALISMFTSPTLATPDSCSSLIGKDPLAQACETIRKELRYIRIYPPSNERSTEKVLFMIAADVFGELHRLNAGSPEAFAVLLQLEQLAPPAKIEKGSAVYFDPITQEPVHPGERKTLIEELKQMNVSAEIKQKVLATQLINKDGFMYPSTRALIQAATSEAERPLSMEESIEWFNKGVGAFRIVRTGRLVDKLPFAEDIVGEKLFDPSVLESGIPKPVNFDFGTLQYRKALR